MKARSISKVILALTPLVVALPFAMDIYIPAVPTITQYMHVTPGMMQLTLNLFMIISGISQLLFGPLTDRYGRRLITLFAIVIFSIASAICTMSNTLTTLLLGRILQACGSCGMMVLGFAIARDLFDDNKLAKVYSFLNGVIAISPMFGPFIGSHLDVDFGWQATFESLLVISVLAILLYYTLLPETWPKEKRTPLGKDLLPNYKKILVNPIFFIYTLSSAFGLSYLFIFCAISPILIITLLHVPELDYGYYFFFMGISLFIGSFIAGMIVEKLGVFRTVLWGYGITLLGAVIMLAWYFITGLTLYNFVLPMVLIGIGGTFALGAGSGGSMFPFEQQAGMASALGGSIRFLYSGIIGLVIANHISSILPLAIPAIIQSVIGIVMLLKNKKILSQTA